MNLDFKCKNMVVRVKDLKFDDHETKCKLNNIGIFKGSIMKVLCQNSSNDVIHIEIDDVEYVLRVEDSSKIEVEEI